MSIGLIVKKLFWILILKRFYYVLKFCKNKIFKCSRYTYYKHGILINAWALFVGEWPYFYNFPVTFICKYAFFYILFRHYIYFFSFSYWRKEKANYENKVRVNQSRFKFQQNMFLFFSMAVLFKFAFIKRIGFSCFIFFFCMNVLGVVKKTTFTIATSCIVHRGAEFYNLSPWRQVNI